MVSESSGEAALSFCRVGNTIIPDGKTEEVAGECYYCGNGQAYYHGKSPCRPISAPDTSDEARRWFDDAGNVYDPLPA